MNLTNIAVFIIIARAERLTIIEVIIWSSSSVDIAGVCLFCVVHSGMMENSWRTNAIWFGGPMGTAKFLFLHTFV